MVYDKIAGVLKVINCFFFYPSLCCVPMLIKDDLYWYSKSEPQAHILGRGLGANVYALDQGDEIWLFDCGLNIINREKNLLKFMKEDGLDPQKISKIFITHAHPDHMNALPFFIEKFNPEVYLHEADAEMFEWDRHEWLRDEHGRIEKYWKLRGTTKLFSKIVTFFTWWTMGRYSHLSKTAISTLLTDDTEINHARHSVRAIHTPGHTLGHTAYYLPHIKTLISGDAINTRFSNKPALNTFNADSSAYSKTIDKLGGLDIEILCDAHGDQPNIGAEKVKKIVSDSRKHLNAAKELVRKKLDDYSSKGASISVLRNIIPKEIWTAVDLKITPLVIMMELIDTRKAYIKDKKVFLQ